jgi:anti-anti-sigma factor
MLTLRVQKLGDVAIIHCVGRIMFPYASELRGIVGHLRTRVLVLDLLNTFAVDAAGLGALVSLRAWAKQNNSMLKLMNVTPRVEQLLQMTKLKSTFEVCSAEEMLDLLCLAIHEHESSRLQLALRDTNAVNRMLDAHSPMLVI